MNWMDKLIDDYVHFLRNETTYRELDGGRHAITTPFLNVYNDAVEIYCKRQDDGKIMIADGGETLSNLSLAGITFNNRGKRKQIFHEILLNYNIQVKEDELFIIADDESKFPQAKHNLLSAISKISDMYLMPSSSTFASDVFTEKVKKYFNDNDVIVTPKFNSQSKSGMYFTFDFQIAGKNTEILINTFNTLQKSNLAIFILAYDSIKVVREELTGKIVKSVPIVNDELHSIKSEYLDTLRDRGCTPLLWSRRNEDESLQQFRFAS